jgi:biopolymer transport protein ExbB/TolQ
MIVAQIFGILVWVLIIFAIVKVLGYFGKIADGVSKLAAKEDSFQRQLDDLKRELEEMKRKG